MLSDDVGFPRVRQTRDAAQHKQQNRRPRARGLWGVLVLIGLAYAVFLIVYRLAEWVFNASPGLSLPPPWSTWLALAATFEPFLLLPLVPLLLVALAMRARAAAGLLALAGLPFVFYYAPLFLPHADAAPNGRTLKVMTHNILAANRLGGQPLADAILAQDADVVALQELVANHANLLAPRLSQAYPHRVVYPAQGLGLYSRYPLREAQLLTLAPESSFAIRAIVDAPGGAITVFNAHPRNPRVALNTWGGSLLYVAEFDPTRRDRAVATLAQAVQRIQGPVVVLGDLNLTDRSAAYRQLTERLRDTHRTAGWGLGYTFPVAGPGARPGFALPILRIDYVLATPDLQAVTCDTGPPAGSDHRPVIATLARAKAT